MRDLGEPKAPDFRRIGDLLKDVAEWRAPGEETVARQSAAPARELAQVWQEVVGEEMAANSRPVQLRQGRLVVSASSSAWAQTLQLMATAIVARLNDRLGGETVKEALFRHAGWEDGPKQQVGDAHPRARTAASERVVPLTAEQMAALESVEALGLEPELRQKITRAMRAAFVRGQQDSVR